MSPEVNRDALIHKPSFPTCTPVMQVQTGAIVQEACQGGSVVRTVAPVPQTADHSVEAGGGAEIRKRVSQKQHPRFLFRPVFT